MAQGVCENPELDKRKHKPVIWQRVWAKWVDQQQGKYFCQCGCGELISVKPFHYCNGPPKYKRGHYPKSGCHRSFTLEERTVAFWNRVNKNGPILQDRPELGPCWLWRGKGQEFYGSLNWDGVVSLPATHISWFLHHGVWPSKFMCHHCDNPPCVNPAHLFDGDHAANMADATRKGRNRKTSYPDQVREVVRLRECGFDRKFTARATGISQQMVDKIMKGKCWSCFVNEMRRWANGQ